MRLQNSSCNSQELDMDYRPRRKTVTYRINAKAEFLWEIKTSIKTEAQPRFL